MLDWLQTGGIRILAVIGVLWIINRFGRYLIRRAIDRAIEHDDFESEDARIRREDTLTGLVYTSFKFFTWSIAILVIISEFGFNLGPLLAGAGVVGIALAFGAQEIVRDFFTGIFIVLASR